MASRTVICLSLITVAILFLANQVASGQTFLKGFPNKKPKQILNDQQDRFFVDYGKSIYVVSKGINYIIKPHDPDFTYRSYDFDNAVASDGTIYCIFESSHRPKGSKTTHYHLYIAKCLNKNCEYSRVASWSSTSGSKSYTSYSASPLRISKQDGVFFKIVHSYSSGDQKKKKTYYYFNSRKTFRERYYQLLTKHFPPAGSGIDIAGELTFKVICILTHIILREESSHGFPLGFGGKARREHERGDDFQRVVFVVRERSGVLRYLSRHLINGMISLWGAEVLCWS